MIFFARQHLTSELQTAIVLLDYHSGRAKHSVHRYLEGFHRAAWEEDCLFAPYEYFLKRKRQNPLLLETDQRLNQAPLTKKNQLHHQDLTPHVLLIDNARVY